MRLVRGHRQLTRNDRRQVPGKSLKAQPAKENGRSTRLRPSLNREASRLGDVRVRRPSFRAQVPETVLRLPPAEIRGDAVSRETQYRRLRVPIPTGIASGSSAKSAMLLQSSRKRAATRRSE